MTGLLFAVIVLAGASCARLVHHRLWQDEGWPARVHLAIAWSLVFVGIVHVAATWVFFSSVSNAALWFASGGIAMSLGGSLNVLQRLYAARAPGLSPACVAGNLAMTTLVVSFIALAGAQAVSEPQFPMLLSFLLAATALSLRPGPADAGARTRPGQ